MVSTARQRARAELTQEILASAREQLATAGAAGLSLRAVARDLGLASSALYRYFPSRDDLLTRLIIEGYDALGAAAEDADDPDRPPRERWHAVCSAVRRWAKTHPHEYALLYGSPVPGYVAPRDTVPAAARVGVVLGTVLGDAARAGALPEASGRPSGSARLERSARSERSPRSERSARPEVPLVTDEAAAVLGGEHPALDDAVRARALLTWSALFGLISFELFGHFVGSVVDADEFFDAQVAELVGLLGL